MNLICEFKIIFHKWKRYISIFFQLLYSYVYAENISDRNADVFINTEVKNDSDTEKTITLEAQIIDQDGKVVQTSTSKKTFAIGEKFTFLTQTSLENPNRWHTHFILISIKSWHF